MSICLIADISNLNMKKKKPNVLCVCTLVFICRVFDKGYNNV